MYKNLLAALILVPACFSTASAQLQVSATSLVPDQNPNFEISRDKYMKTADSINNFHSTTVQETYDAIDWMEDRQQAKDARRDFRRQLRMERARNWRYGGYNNYYRDRDYRDYNYNYNRNYWRNNNYWRNRSSWFRCW